MQRYAILLANGRGAYQPLDADCMEQRELAETVRKLLQAAKLDGWQVPILAYFAYPRLGGLSRDVPRVAHTIALQKWLT